MLIQHATWLLLIWASLLQTAAGEKTHYKPCEAESVCMCVWQKWSATGSGKTYFSWKALLVPLWSKSWHTQPTISAKVSTSVRVSWKPAVWFQRSQRENTHCEHCSHISYSLIIWNCEEYIEYKWKSPEEKHLPKKQHLPKMPMGLQ